MYTLLICRLFYEWRWKFIYDFISSVKNGLVISVDESKPLVCSGIDLDNIQTMAEVFVENLSTGPESDLDVKVSNFVYQC